jgi:hypothetical protein
MSSQDHLKCDAAVGGSSLRVMSLLWRGGSAAKL